MDRLALDYDVMPSGCCGMAGSFGFESGKYDVSMKAGERVALPRVRAASSDCLILANGFSCREQIEQGAGRRTRHLAEIMQHRCSARSAWPDCLRPFSASGGIYLVFVCRLKIAEACRLLSNRKTERKEMLSKAYVRSNSTASQSVSG
jgi:hypothetical protein